MDPLWNFPDFDTVDHRLQLVRGTLCTVRSRWTAILALGYWYAHLWNGSYHCEYKDLERN